jgi:two-component system response regulator NreC
MAGLPPLLVHPGCVSPFSVPLSLQSGGLDWGADEVEKIRILLADDHTILRAGMRLLLERQPDFEVVAEASDGRQAVELAEQQRPDIAVLDIAMPMLNGMEAARQIAAKLTNTKVIILSMHSDEGYVLRSLQAGIRGYLLKDSTDADVIGAIRAVNEGKAFLSPEVSRMLVENYATHLQGRGAEDSYETLTTREREVLQLLAEGRSNKEASGILNVSLATLETHRSKIFQKLNLHSMPELILYAVRRGLVS